MQEDDKAQKEQERKPDEKGVILVDEHIRIYDPNTGEEFLNKRES